MHVPACGTTGGCGWERSGQWGVHSPPPDPAACTPCHREAGRRGGRRTGRSARASRPAFKFSAVPSRADAAPPPWHKHGTPPVPGSHLGWVVIRAHAVGVHRDGRALRSCGAWAVFGCASPTDAPRRHGRVGARVQVCVCVCACMPPCARAPVSACVRVDACKRGSCPHARTHTYTQPSTGDDAHCPISARAPWRRQLRRHRLLGHSLGGRHTAAAAGLAASPSCCCVGRLLLSTRAQPHSAASRGIQKN